MIDREETILKFYPIVQMIARQLARRLPDTVDVEELISVGMLGLIDAVDRFEPARGVPLKSYAEIRIKGAMLDALRSNDWIPRSVRRKQQMLERTRQDLSRRLGRVPNRAEMATAMELDGDDYDKLVREGNAQRLLSLDVPLSEDGAMLVDMIKASSDDAEQSLTDRELRSALTEAIQMLSEKERVAISLSYLEGYTLREIGGMMGVSESRVCQIRSRAVRRLRRRLEASA